MYVANMLHAFVIQYLYSLESSACFRLVNGSPNILICVFFTYGNLIHIFLLSLMRNSYSSTFYRNNIS